MRRDRVIGTTPIKGMEKAVYRKKTMKTQRTACRRGVKVKLTGIIFLMALSFGCAQKNPADIQVSRLVEYSDRLGQAHVQLFRYSGEVKKKNIKAYAKEKLGCNMLYAFFYPDTVSMNAIPVEEISTARSFVEVQDILFRGEGVARWRYAVQCLSVIPIVVDCSTNPVSQNCR